MSARQWKRLRKLERRVESLENLAASPVYFGTAGYPMTEKEYDEAMDAAWEVMNPKRGLIQRIKDFFR